MIISPDWFTPETAQQVWDITGKQVAKLLPEYDVLVLMVGLPGSGKSTWLVDHAKPGRLYVDATLCLPEWRKPFIDIAQQANKPVISVWVDTPLDVCLERNAERQPDRRIPEGKYDEWWASLMESPPGESEGLHASWRITQHDATSWVCHEVPQYTGHPPQWEKPPADLLVDDLLLRP